MFVGTDGQLVFEMWCAYRFLLFVESGYWAEQVTCESSSVLHPVDRTSGPISIVKWALKERSDLKQV